MKKWAKCLYVFTGALLLTGFLAVSADAKISAETEQCLECHAERMPGLIEQWQYSTHWQSGVGCYECHAAQKGEVDALDHNGFVVATIVSPRDCAKCHPKESAEQEASHHAKAGNLDHRGIGDIYTLTVDEYLQQSKWEKFKYRLYRHPLFLFVIKVIIKINLKIYLL